MSAVCSFRRLEPGVAYKVIFAAFLILLLSFISHYWSCEFFKVTGLSVKENQPLAESLKEASLPEMTAWSVEQTMM